MDTIFISELRMDALVGVYGWEHHVRQTIEISIELAVDAARPARSGDLADAVDYAKVVGRVRDTIAARHFPLLEHLAETLAETVMREFGVPWIRISVAKLGALPGVRKLGVAIERGHRD